MSNVKLSVAALNQVALDWDGNERRILTAIQQAKAEGTQLLILPEMAICGYGCEDTFLGEGVYEESLAVLKALLAETLGISVLVGLPILHEKHRYNAAALLVDGELVAIQCKKNLAGDGLHYEPRWFTAWPSGLSETISIFNKSIPIGDLRVKLGDYALGFEICEDSWVETRGCGSLANYQASLICNPSASHFAFDKQKKRRALAVNGSKIFNSTYAYANMCSNEAGRVIYDGACLVAQKGDLIFESKRFSFEEVQVHTVTVSLDEAVDQSYDLELDLSWQKSSDPVAQPVEASDFTKYEEFYLAETLGLFDYMRKSFSRGFVLSLSGGVDSAACATLIYQTFKRAESELGLEALKKVLSYFKALQSCSSVEEMMPHLLICVYQATRNSGAVTENAAESLAKAISSEYDFFNVDSVLQGYHDLIEKSIDRSLSWETDDLTLQNIQARVRAPSVWMLANLRSALLITTSNRSEAAVGYATMDGDTSGGLCPLGGVDKTFLRDWLRWAEIGQEGLVDGLTALSFVNEQEPTAELRPQETLQEDEKDLMPYGVLDFIEKASIRDKKTPRHILAMLCEEYSEFYNDAQLFAFLKKFYQLWSRNQWKRERYAPSFHVDDESLDPKTWCRFPILSGAYSRELRQLEAEL